MPSGNAAEAKSKRRRAKLGGGGRGKDGSSAAKPASAAANPSAGVMPLSSGPSYAPSVANRKGKTGQLSTGRAAGKRRSEDQRGAKGRALGRGDLPKPKPNGAAAAPAAAKPHSVPSKPKAPAKGGGNAVPAIKPAAKGGSGLGGMPAPLAPARTGLSDATAASGRAAARGEKTAAVDPMPKRVSSFTQKDATGSSTGDRWRSTRYSAMDRNK